MNPPDPLDVRLLRLFEAVYATGSITLAAEVLGLAQPTISIGLGKLRRHFGDPLFVRTSEGMLPTPFADGMIGAVRDALQAMRHISEWRSGFDPAVSTRAFRIAMTDASHITLLPALLAAVRAAAPGIQLEASRIDAGLPAALQSGDVDIALGFIPALDAGFYQQTLFEQDWICLTRRVHPIFAQGMTLDAYRAAAHIAIPFGTGQLLLEQALATQGIERAIALKLPGFLGLSTIIGASDLVATLPRHIGSTLADLGTLAMHACPFEIESFFVRQHWHARYHTDPANRWLRHLCAKLFGGR